MRGFDASRAGVAAGIIAAGVVLLCGLLILTVPNVALTLFNGLFHGLDLEPIFRPKVGFAGVVLSTAGAFAATWAVVVLYGWLYALLGKKG